MYNYESQYLDGSLMASYGVDTITFSLLSDECLRRLTSIMIYLTLIVLYFVSLSKLRIQVNISSSIHSLYREPRYVLVI